MLRTIEELGDPKRFTSNLGFSTDMLEKIGSIVVVSGNIEFILEKAFIKLSGGTVDGSIPVTTRLIANFRDLNRKSPSQFCKTIELWCEAAFIYMSCRNSIVHGNAFSFGNESVWFAKSLPVEGIKRNNNYSEFLADPHTLGLFLNAGTLLCRVINIINFSLDKPMQYDEDILIAAVQNARSTCAELNDLAGAFGSDKY